MDRKTGKNAAMDIVTRIAKNLSAWMLAHKTLSTLEAVVDKSGVGYGTVRRIKKGEINATIENLERIASAFDRSVADLIADPGEEAKAIYDPKAEGEATDVVQFGRRREDARPVIGEIVELCMKLDDVGLGKIKFACEFAMQDHSLAASEKSPLKQTV